MTIGLYTLRYHIQMKTVRQVITISLIHILMQSMSRLSDFLYLHIILLLNLLKFFFRHLQ